MIVEDYIYQKIDKPLFHLIGETADELGLETYVVGGFVRDLFLSRPSKDIDVVSVGRGIELAEAVAKRLKGSHLSVFARLKSSTKAQRLSLSVLGVRVIARTAVNPLSKMVLCKKTKSVETLPSMHSLSVLIKTASANSLTLSMDSRIWII